MLAPPALEGLRSALPAERYREPAAYPIDDICPSVAARPETAEEVAALLAAASDAGAAVAPLGGRTALELGRPLERYDIALDMAGLDSIIEYEPADLTITIEAGATLKALQARLGLYGQYLPVDLPPGDEVTIGGLLATARSGAWRGHLPAARDLVLGLTVATPEGTLVTSGGRVVKNVSGYDLHRMHTGALGTLGAIVRASFKVAPVPEATSTLMLPCTNIEQAERAAFEVWDRGLPLRALTLVGPAPAAALGIEGGHAVLVELAGVAPAVERGRREVVSLGGRDHDAATWRALRFRAAGDDGRCVLRLGVPPSEVRATLEAVAARGLEAWAHLAAGSVLATGGDVDASTVEALRAYAASRGGFLQVEAAHARLRMAVDPFAGGDLELTRTLKQQLDPRRTLNPGRWAEGV